MWEVVWGKYYNAVLLGDCSDGGMGIGEGYAVFLRLRCASSTPLGLSKCRSGVDTRYLVGEGFRMELGLMSRGP